MDDNKILNAAEQVNEKIQKSYDICDCFDRAFDVVAFDCFCGNTESTN